MRGGKRPGAGRKKGFAARNAEEARRALADMVARDIVPIGEALVERAKKGEIAAVRELFDRAWGKSPQAMDIDVHAQNDVVLESNGAARASQLSVLFDELVKLNMQPEDVPAVRVYIQSWRRA